MLFIHAVKVDNPTSQSTAFQWNDDGKSLVTITNDMSPKSKSKNMIRL